MRGRTRGSVCIWARDSIWKTPIVSAAQMESYTRSSSKSMRERSMRFPRCSSMRSSISSTAESMPRARKSILIMRASSTESLSHWMRTRPSMADCSSGTSSISGREEMTMPPTCWVMWRGKPAICSTRSARCRQTRESPSFSR